MKLSKSEAGKLGAIKSSQLYQERKKLKEIEYNNNPMFCIKCGSKISFEKFLKKRKCCSASCSASINNIMRTKYHSCLECNKETRIKKLFCSKECELKYKERKETETVKSNGFFPQSLENGNDSTQRRIARKFLLQEYGHVCSICKTEKWNDKDIPLIVDHIDGNQFNNKIDNFRLICPNCDAQLPTYKSKNKNSKRKYRNEYKPGLGSG